MVHCDGSSIWFFFQDEMFDLSPYAICALSRKSHRVTLRPLWLLRICDVGHTKPTDHLQSECSINLVMIPVESIKYITSHRQMKSKLNQKS